MESPPAADAPWRSGIQGARANLLPGVMLQLTALALVLGYYYVPDVHGALARLVEIRRTAGFGFSIVSTALFGGMLPFLYIRFSAWIGKERPRYAWVQGLSLTAFWGYKGFEVDLWYHLQALMFGGGHDVATIVLKVVFDQFLYCPFIAVPVTVAVYQAVDARRNWGAILADLRAPGWYRRRVLPVLISNLGVWVPTVAVIYCLPTPLQLPLQNIVLCFYTPIVAHQMRTGANPVPALSGSEAPGLNPTH
jgi:hypothetical protein